MADDEIASFFAQKKAKKAGKPKVQKIDNLARKLEESVKQQEMLDEERDMLMEMEAANQLAKDAVEDPEWIVPVDESGDVNLDVLKIREMDLSENEDEEEEANKENTEAPKTWKTEAESKADAAAAQEKKAAEPVVEDATPKRYVAKGRLLAEEKAELASGRPGKKPDLQDSMQFPTLASAADIQQKELEKKKKITANNAPLQGSAPAAPVRSAWGQPRMATPDEIPAAQENNHRSESPAEPLKTATLEAINKPGEEKAETAAAPAATAGKSSYVPPHLRKKTGN
jgi:hypothetical protein